MYLETKYVVLKQFIREEISFYNLTTGLARASPTKLRVESTG